MLIINDRIEGIEFLKSPNARGVISPKFLIIHPFSIWDYETCTDVYLDGEYSKRAAHLLISKEGDMRQFVEFNRKAWHIGSSYYQGHFGLNSCSIGIILEGRGDVTDTQKRLLDSIVPELVNTYNLRDIVTSQEVALINTGYSCFSVDSYRAYTDFKNADSGGRYTVTTVTPLPLREGPDDVSETVHEIPTGAEVRLLRINQNWRFVQHDSNVGWVREEYIKRL